jgi:16S rRNA (uracil1498-N3)-methyltransferase
MTRRRWIADEVRGNRAILTGAHADHLLYVLRVRVGQEFDISTGTKVFRGTVVAVHDHEVEFDLDGELPSLGSALNISLMLAIFKFDRMEWAIEKCTELGVSRIVPVISRRTDAHLAAASAKRVERWGRIARQASEQSRRAGPPDISAPTNLKNALMLPGSLHLVLAETENRLLLSDYLQQQHPQSTDLVLAIGPEGGWTNDELQLFKQANWIPVSLGPNILRAETAAIAALAVVTSLLA